MVSVMEKEIFKKVEFKMPLYTPVHCIEILLTATGIGETPKTVDISMQLLDLAYLKVCIRFFYLILYTNFKCIIILYLKF